MSFTYYLLRLPSFVLLLLMMFLFAAVGTITTHLFRKYIQPNPKKLHNEMMGHFFGLLGGIYGLLLGFVVVLVWGAYNDTQTNASKEGSLALSLYREIRYLPDSAKPATLMQSYLAFVHSVLENEYPQMETLHPFTLQNNVPIDRLYQQLEKLHQADDRSGKIIENLDQLAMYRSLREVGAYSDIPVALWIPLMLGYFVLIVCALFLDIESASMHRLVNGLLGAFVGLIIYIILLVNHPFAGSLKVEPEQYRLILQLASHNE